jgi:hypothetical protein
MSFTDGECIPMVPCKFLHLKFLSIATGGLTFGYLSLISFLDASPSLETFILAVRHLSSTLQSYLLL